MITNLFKVGNKYFDNLHNDTFEVTYANRKETWIKYLSGKTYNYDHNEDNEITFGGCGSILEIALSEGTIKEL